MICFTNLFDTSWTDKQVAEQDENEKDPWKFKELGKQLREAKYLVAFDRNRRFHLSQKRLNLAMMPLSTFGMDVRYLIQILTIHRQNLNMPNTQSSIALADTELLLYRDEKISVG